MLIFDRLKSSYCDICDRIHDSIGMYICIYHNENDTTAIRKCYQNKDKYVTIYNDKCVSGNSDVNDYDWSYIQDKYQYKTLDAFQLKIFIEELKNVIIYKSTGASSIIVNKTKSNTYETQRSQAFFASIDDHYVEFEGKKLSFATIIKTRLFKYNDIQFAPNGIVPLKTFNLFKGLLAKEIQNDVLIQPILNHVKQIWANSNETVYNYILDWFASVVKGIKTGTVLVIYSNKQGTGKNVIADFIKNKVIGAEYATETNDIEKLTTKFNAKFTNKIFTIINEANSIEGSYHKTFDILKDLITNQTITIEKKGVDSFDVADFNNYLITTNNDRPVKVEEHDRRYSLIRINETKARDEEYFNNLFKYTIGEFSDDCANAFLYFLKTRLITNNIHQAINTEWKQQLIRLHCTQDSTALFSQSIKYPVTENNEISLEELYSDYIDFCLREQLKAVTKLLLVEKLTNLKFIESTRRVNRRVNGKQTNYHVVKICTEYIDNEDDIDPNQLQL